MHIFRTGEGIVVKYQGHYYKAVEGDWNKFINREDLYAAIQSSLSDGRQFERLPVFDERQILAPIDRQEVWAAGVTYLRSRAARMEESKDAGGGSFYDRVYEADRPELFFKAIAQRVAGHQGKVRIRKDSTWDVPEPELTLFISSAGNIQGYTIGNDMSSRSIEGENPLYLPQAKSYDGSAGLGPCIYVPAKPIGGDAQIGLTINRDGKTVFNESISIDRMKRGHHELAGYLFRECSFPDGVFLMTGTGIIPPNDFTLKRGDEIMITVDGIGTLTNFVE